MAVVSALAAMVFLFAVVRMAALVIELLGWDGDDDWA